jgi:hypothetical protein
MTYERIPDLNNGGFFSIMTVDDFEYENPVFKFKQLFIEHNVNFERSILLIKKPNFPVNLVDNLLNKRAEEEWKQEYHRINTVKIPKVLTELLNSNSKKQQIKLLKGLSMDYNLLVSFIFYSWEKMGYTYSSYRSEHLHIGSEKNLVPKFIYKNDKDGSIEHHGTTNLSEGQMKQIIEHRSVKISKFLDKNEKWHCFFHTYNSLGGHENGSMPHIHYISNFWGLSREYVLTQLQSKKYQLSGCLHINYKK